MAVADNIITTERLLTANRKRLLRELGRDLRTYEARYELRSDKLDEALAKGQIAETAEVCSWLIAFHTYRDLLDEERSRSD